MDELLEQLPNKSEHVLISWLDYAFKIDIFTVKKHIGYREYIVENLYTIGQHWKTLPSYKATIDYSASSTTQMTSIVCNITFKPMVFVTLTMYYCILIAFWVLASSDRMFALLLCLFTVAPIFSFYIEYKKFIGFLKNLLCLQ